MHIEHFMIYSHVYDIRNYLLLSLLFNSHLTMLKFNNNLDDLITFLDQIPFSNTIVLNTVEPVTL